MALSDVCDDLRTQTGIRISAGPSVADEKVTLFCEELPLRDVMRQLSRPFGYAWVRSTRKGEYCYELLQDLRSQLLEEELRNRDRHAAWLSLDKEIEQYRPYLDLSPDDALARAAAVRPSGGTGSLPVSGRAGGEVVPPAEKKLLEQYAGFGWGLAQLYFRLSPQQSAALRAGQPLLFSPAPEPGQHLLSPDLVRGVVESQRDHRLLKGDKGFQLGNAAGLADGLPLTASPRPAPCSL